MRNTDIAYIAGIFDGEGSVLLGINKAGESQSYRIQVALANTNEWICQWLKLGFGGCVSCEFKKGNRKPLWQWRTSSNKAVYFLETILPYLHIKKAQAEIAVRFQKTRKRKDYINAEADRILIANLNHRGKVEPLISQHKNMV